MTPVFSCLLSFLGVWHLNAIVLFNFIIGTIVGIEWVVLVVTQKLLLRSLTELVFLDPLDVGEGLFGGRDEPGPPLLQLLLVLVLLVEPLVVGPALRSHAHHRRVAVLNNTILIDVFCST